MTVEGGGEEPEDLDGWKSELSICFNGGDFGLGGIPWLRSLKNPDRDRVRTLKKLETDQVEQTLPIISPAGILRMQILKLVPALLP